jgi:hypothetical protein
MNIDEKENDLLSKETKLRSSKMGAWLFAILAIIGAVYFSSHTDLSEDLSFNECQSALMCFFLTALFLLIGQYYQAQLRHIESIKRYKRLTEKSQPENSANRCQAKDTEAI